MKRPSFQFYPADWRANANLRRCSDAARGAWMDIMCVLHDSDEYGICRWPLADLARAAGVPMKLARELADKSVLKGGDAGMDEFTYTPTHAGQDGETCVLIPKTDKPCWFCSRFVRDEFIRSRRGSSTRFDTNNQPKTKPTESPNRRVGDELGDGPSSSSSSSSSDKNPISLSGPKPKTPDGPTYRKSNLIELAKPILEKLNELTGRKYEATANNLEAIACRIEEVKLDTDGIVKMLERQVTRWKGDPKMEEYLRVSTLFNRTKFHEYYSARELPVAPSQPLLPPVESTGTAARLRGASL